MAAASTRRAMDDKRHKLRRRVLKSGKMVFANGSFRQVPTQLAFPIALRSDVHGGVRRPPVTNCTTFRRRLRTYSEVRRGPDATVHCICSLQLASNRRRNKHRPLGISIEKEKSKGTEHSCLRCGRVE